MTMKHWMLLGALTAGAFLRVSLVGQTATAVPADPPPLIPASEPAKAAPKSTPKPTPARPAPAPERGPAADLRPGTAVATEKSVNVRGQARINSEVVTQLKRGDVVTVLEQITLRQHGENEPGKWAKISLPTGSTVWVHSYFIDAGSKKVKANRLNLRSGPGENYSILGRIEKGVVVEELERKGEWIKFEAPTNSYAFAAAHLLSQEPQLLAAALARTAPKTIAKTPIVTTPVEAVKPVETVAVKTSPILVVPPAPETPTVPPSTTISTPTVPAETLPPPTPPTALVTTPEPPASVPVPIPTVEIEPLVRRVVTREGIVRGSVSIQAPTYLVLRSLDNNKTINYLHSIDTNIVLRAFQYQRVIVVGEEILDERWPNTPVIDVESIEAVP